MTAGAVLGFGYVSFFSMCLGYFAWYQGMARGGVARVGRLQLAQPALTLGWSALLIGEHVSWLSATAAAAVIAVTAVGRNARVDPARAPEEYFKTQTPVHRRLADQLPPGAVPAGQLPGPVPVGQLPPGPVPADQLPPAPSPLAS